MTAAEAPPVDGARPPARDLVLVALALAAALGGFWVAQWRIAGTLGWSSFPLDDSWIHLQFARNLAEGRGFSYNPGVPVGGSTAPLWTLVLALAYALGGAHPYWAKLIGAAAALLTACLAHRLAWRWTADRAIALLVGVVTAIAGPAVWGALSGMEVSLAACLVTGAIVCHTARRDVATAALLGLAVLARPESLMVVPLVWLAGAITWRRTGIVAVATFVCVAPWVAFNLRTTGTPLPATAAAKVEGGLIGLLSGTREPVPAAVFARPWRFEREWTWWLLSVDLLLPLLILLGLAVLWSRRGRAAGLPALVLVLHPIGVALLAPYRGPGFQEGRYAIHLLPLAIAAAGVGLGTLPRGRGLRSAAMAIFLVAAVAAAGPAASRYAWAVQNIDAMQVSLGEWVATHTAPEARLALNDVGAIAYVSRREVVDLMGLVTPAILPYRRQGEPGVLRYLERACPDYLVIFPAWFPTLAARSDRFRPIHRVRLGHNTVAGADEMVVYETPWSRWRESATPCPAGENAPRTVTAVKPVYSEHRHGATESEPRSVGLGEGAMRTVLARCWPLGLATLLVGFLGVPRTAAAQIYRWIDDQGTPHYSQGIDSVPLSVRSRAVVVGEDRPAPSPEPAATPAASAPGSGQVRFTPGQPIVVAARVNGGGPVQLMLDTGAARTVIHPTALAALGVSYQGSQRGTLKGVTGDAEVEAVKVDSIEVAGVTHGPLLVISHDTGFGSDRGDGLLGRDFLDHFTLNIDNAGGLLTLTPK